MTRGSACRALALPGLAAWACARAPVRLDTTCPVADRGAAPEQLFARLAGQGIVGAPDTLRFRIDGREVVVGWKNLLSGRALTLSCAYARDSGEWRLLSARLDDGTHALRVTGRADPPSLIYRDAAGRLLGIVAVRPLIDEGRTP